MTATNLFEADILDLLMTNVAAPNVGDAAGLPPSVTVGNWAISLHTVTILDTATVQTQNEAAYTNYARVNVVRSVAQWTISGTTIADNDNAITFPQSGSGPETELDVGMGGNAGVMQIFDPLTASLVVNNLVTPEFAAQALAVSID